MSITEQLLKEWVSPSEDREAVLELNKGYYITSFLEDDCLYHTTSWKALKNILQDGFLSGNPDYLRQKGVHQRHAGMICFTTSKWRHLSDLPTMSLSFGLVSHPCYLKIPFYVLKGRVKPVVYEISQEEIKDLIDSGQAYYLTTLTQNVEALRKEYGEDFEKFLYNTWYVENEWRMKADKFELPPETEVYVSSRYQLKRAKTITSLPVYLDREMLALLNHVNEPRRKRNKIRRIIGDDFYRKIRHVEIRKGEVKRPDGKVSMEQAVLYDVRFLDAQIIVRRLNRAGLTVWCYGNAWKHRPYADLEVDLTLKPERGTCIKNT